VNVDFPSIRVPQKDAVDTTETTSSDTYTDLATSGPTVTVHVGTSGILFVNLTALMSNDTAGRGMSMGFALSSANTLAATFENSIWYLDIAAEHGSSGLVVVTGLTAGSTVVTAKYRRTNGVGTASFRWRKLTAWSL